MSDRFKVKVMTQDHWVRSVDSTRTGSGILATADRREAAVFEGPAWRAFFEAEKDHCDIVPEYEMPERLRYSESLGTPVFEDGSPFGHGGHTPFHEHCLDVKREMVRRYNLFPKLVEALAKVFVPGPTGHDLRPFHERLIAEARGEAAR